MRRDRKRFRGKRVQFVLLCFRLERVRSRLMGFDEAWRESTAWSDSLRLAFNRSKCVTLTFGRSKCAERSRSD